jgi:hypothetical protein
MDSYDEKRINILRMVEEGTLGASDAAALLSALGREMQGGGTKFSSETMEPPAQTTQALPEPENEATSGPGSRQAPRFFRVRVTDLHSGRAKVTVNLPIGLVHWGMRFGARFSPEVKDFDFSELKEMLDSGVEGRLIDVLDEEDGEHVEIFVD